MGRMDINLGRMSIDPLVFAVHSDDAGEQGSGLQNNIEDPSEMEEGPSGPNTHTESSLDGMSPPDIGNWDECLILWDDCMYYSDECGKLGRMLFISANAAGGVCRAIPVRHRLYACMEGRNAIVSHHQQLFNLGVSKKKTNKSLSLN